MDIPRYQMAEKAFNILSNQIENCEKTEKVMIDSKLVIRDSVKETAMD